MAEARARREEAAPVRAVAPEAVAMRERIHWAPIWAGIGVALGAELVLNAIGIAIGFVPTATTAAAVTSVSTAFGIWTVIVAVVSLFLGGYVASRLMPEESLLIGTLHGVAVWAITLITGTLLVAFFGLNGFLGFLGNATGAAHGLIGFGAAPSAASASFAASSNAWFIFWSLLALISASIGGYLGMVRSRASMREIP